MKPHQMTYQEYSARKSAVRTFTLVFLVAAIAGGLGFVQGRSDTVSLLENNKSNTAAAITGGFYSVAGLISGKESLPSGSTKVKTLPVKTKSPDKLEGGKKEACGLTDFSDNCKDFCSTSYVTVKKGKSSVKNCDPLKFENPIGKAIKEYNECLAKGGGDPKKAVKGYTEATIKQRICLTLPDQVRKDIAKQFSDKKQKRTAEAGVRRARAASLARRQAQAGTGLAKASSQELEKIEICKDKLKAIYKAKKDGIALAKKKSKATAEDAKKCAWKGVANCSATFDLKTKKMSSVYVCKSKGAKGKDQSTKKVSEYCKKHPNDSKCKTNPAYDPSNPNGPSGPSGPSGPGGISNPDNYQNRTLKDAASGFAKGFADALKNLGKGGGGGSSKPSKPSAKCDSFELSKTTIKRGEKIELRWETSNAKKVRITNTTGAIVGKTGLDGVRGDVRPQRSGTFTLKAYGRNGGADASCTQSITVEGSIYGEEGEYPPKLTCSPDMIEKGKDTKVTVKWSCKGPSTKSVGVGVNTAGKLTDYKKVSPNKDRATEYTVKCFDGAKEIGKRTCFVKIGKPLYDIIVYPSPAKKQEKVRVSWGSIGMTTCRVKDPDDPTFDYEQENGVVTTIPFPKGSREKEKIYNIKCTSRFGKTYSRDIKLDLNED